MPADQKAVIAIAKLRDRAGIRGEHTFRVNRDGRQIAGENEGTLRGKEKHVSHVNAHGRLLANIYPREIEELLCGHPAIADAQAFGVPDDFNGEELCAWIKLKPGATATEDDIKAFCRDRITYFKIPRQVRFVDRYPMTVTGKVQSERMTKELRQMQQNPA